MASMIRIDEYSKTPKYRQIINSVVAAIEKGEIKLGDKLPSVNKLLIEFDISRDTVVKAYDTLKDMGIIGSIPGKGFYIQSENFKQNYKIFLLFNKLSAHKKIIYDSFTATLGEKAAVDFYIYNNNFRLFKNLLHSLQDESYTHYVIIAHFLEGGGDEALRMINELPKEKLVMLDKKIEGVSGDFAAVYQDFHNDIYQALSEALDYLRKYSKLNMIFPTYGYHPKEIITGFVNFCDEFAFNYEVIDDISSARINKDEVYINLKEDDLVVLIKRIKELKLEVGKEVGIISYNETPLKEILLDGITVVSTDFEKLGETAATMILEGSKEHVANPFKLVIRNSL